MLMPIGGANAPTDVAPEPIRLDQISVDQAITDLIQTQENNKDNSPEKIEQVSSTTSTNKNTAAKNVKPLSEAKPVVKGALTTKTYALKKKADGKRHSFKCSECKVITGSIKELNTHHAECHNSQLCGLCGQSFQLASSLMRHMYDHTDIKYKCDQCDYSCHFESEMRSHRVVHWKNPSHQCMKANCGKWFMQKWDLTLHQQKHNGKQHVCHYADCKFSTDTKKQLKEHQKKHTDDFSHQCTICGKGFHYHSGLKRHRDKEHK